MNREKRIDDYFQTLNELDETRRIELIQKVWAADGMFVSLVGKAQGHLEISNLIRGFYEHSPDAAVRQTGNIEVLHNDYLRFGFEVVQSDGATISSGTDFAVIENGKLRLVAGFFNPAPHNAASLTSQEIINTAKQVYQAFNAGDMVRWFTFFAPTFEWYAADNSPIADHSPYRGLDAVRDEVFPRLAALFPGMQLRLTRFWQPKIKL